MALQTLMHLLLSVACLGAAAPLDIEELVARTEDAVVTIYGGPEGQPSVVQGSGCCVAPSGLILTSAHVLHPGTAYRGRFADGKEYPLHLIEEDRKRDLALFQAVLGEDLRLGIRLGDARALKKGAFLLAITTPENLEFTVSTGIVSGLERRYRQNPVIQTTLALAAGSSGGPVFDAQGTLVGIVFGRLDDFPEGSLVYPINQAYAMLSAKGVVIPGEAVSSTGTTDPSLSALDLFKEGVAASSGPEKIARYEAAVERDPELYEAWFNLGHAYGESGRPDEAVRAYERARALRPNAIEVNRNLGRLYVARNRYDEAIVCFTHALDIEPDNAVSHNDLGEACRRAGLLSQAEGHFRRAIQLEPGHAFAYFNLGLTYLQRGQRDQAAEAFAAYLERYPDAPDKAQVHQWIAALRKAPAGPEAGGG